jgi:glycine oxidase
MKVVVIGAGVAGLAIGWRLVQAGAEVTVLDRTQPGHGATWAAAGMIAAAAELGEAQTPEAEFAYQSRSLWPDFAKEVEEASGIAIGYSQSGSLLIATDEEQAASFAARAAADPELAMLTATEAHAKEPMLTASLSGALWVSKEAQVDNRALGQALAQAFVRAGGKLVPNESVVRIETENGRAVAARTPFWVHYADAFVLAAGAWSGMIDGLPQHSLPPVKPMKGEMLALAPSKGAVLPTHVVWGNEVYLVPRGGRLLIGATLEDVGFDTALTPAARSWLSGRALGLMPGLAGWKIVEHWAGLRPASPDGLPILGETATEGLFAACGQHRNGILFAPAIGQFLSRLVLTRSREDNPFDPRRFAGQLAP